MKSSLRQRALAATAAALVMSVVSVGVSAASSGSSLPRDPGVTSNSITIGATVPESGPAAGYYEVSSAANAVFKYVNAKGGINGRQIDYIRLDDCYNLAPLLGGCGNLTASQTTYTQTQVLVVDDHVFATVGSLGTAAQDSVRNYLNAEGVPQLFVNSGASDWNNPTKWPMLFGFQASYGTEGNVFAKYITTKYHGDKIGFIGQNDGFGQEEYAGLTKGSVKLTITGGENLYNWTDTGSATELNTFIGNLKTDNVKVVVLASIPPITEALLTDAHNDGFKPTWIISSVGSDPVSVNTSLESGATTTGGFPATNASTSWNSLVRTILLADKADFPSFTSTTVLDGNMQYGVAWAVAFLEALKSLGATPTRAGIVAAMKTTKFALNSVTPLTYSATNHQGLQCAIISSIHSGGTRPTEYTVESSKTVYCSAGTTGAKVTTKTEATAAIPSWL
jgi:ABC-type branched-subunit amino acid transport system substrate-binding protein